MAFTVVDLETNEKRLVYSLVSAWRLGLANYQVWLGKRLVFQVGG